MKNATPNEETFYRITVEETDDVRVIYGEGFNKGNLDLNRTLNQHRALSVTVNWVFPRLGKASTHCYIPVSVGGVQNWEMTVI